MKPISCPSCHSEKIQHMGKKYAVYPYGCVALMGFPLVLLHQGQTPLEYRCEACDCHFTRRSALAKFNLILLILMIAAFLIFLSVVIFGR